MKPPVTVVWQITVGRGRGRRELDTRDMELVRQWIEFNREPILAYWNGDLLTDEVIARLKPVASA